MIAVIRLFLALALAWGSALYGLGALFTQGLGHATLAFLIGCTLAALVAPGADAFKGDGAD